ncbi:hypothetical protein TIFTF001_034333 [Ficus carica]|uniref:Retrotransposon gag domain-containing protein n=1 Tax=Ficus carica TaxID=3494 RepID=A0AA88E089_FICCA|nr:hypothetical protein TIFTF001_034333 [Ficus carica]
MVRTRTQTNQNPQEPALANVVAMLQQQLLQQQEEMNRLREQIARLNQMPRANEIPPQDNPAPPVVPKYQRKRVLCASFALKKDARHWWITVQMRRNVAAMSWQDFVAEFKTMYYNNEILAAQQDEFNSLKQGSMTVLEAIKKFEQLGRLCPELIPNEKEKVRRMMKMFRTDIAKQVSAGSSPPTLVSDCISRVIRAEYWINQDKEVRAQIFKAKKGPN